MTRGNGPPRSSGSASAASVAPEASIRPEARPLAGSRLSPAASLTTTRGGSCSRCPRSLLDERVRAGENQRGVTRVQPFDGIRRRAIVVPDCGDQPDSPLIADVRALQYEPIADVRLHYVLLRSSGRAQA